METVDSRWKAIHSTIKSVSEKVISIKKKTLVNPGSMKYVRKNTMNAWLSDSSNIKKERKYKDCQKEVNKIFRNEKR